MILLSHPTGNTFTRAALVSLYEAGLLHEFQTTIAAYPGNLWDILGRSAWGREFQRRAFDERLRPLTVQHPCRELGRMLANRLKLARLIRHETGIFCIDAVYLSLDRSVARRLRANPQAFTGVYAYEDGAREAFRVARDLRLHCYYDLPIAYWETAQRLLQEEAKRLPAWEPTLGGTRDSDRKLARKAEELELAEVVICPSQFVADSIPQDARSKKRIVVAPFGSPELTTSGIEDGRLKREIWQKGRRKLRVLFVGSMTQRKGLGDLMAAMQLLKRNDVELVVMGSLQVPMDFYRKELSDFIYEPGRPHAQVLALMGECDVLCLPSIVEGRALVMQEAMSQGLPLIITPNTGGADLIEEGVTGFLVPIRSPEIIAARLDWCADHRDELRVMGRSATQLAATCTWENYGWIVVDAIRAAGG